MSFLHNLKRDALNTLRGLEPQNIMQAFAHPGRTLGGMADFYGQLARHPIGTFENAPISTALGFAPGVGPLAKLAKLRMAGEAGGLSALDLAGLDASVLKSPAEASFLDVLKSPAEASFADVAVAPRTSFDLPSENGFGIAMPDVPVANMLDAIKRGPQFGGRTFDAQASLDTALPLHPDEMPINSPNDIYDVANVADYINPDAPDMNLMMSGHEAAMANDASYSDWANSMPEASGQNPGLGPEQFQHFYGDDAGSLQFLDPGNVDPTQSFLNEALGQGFGHTLSANTLAELGPSVFTADYLAANGNGVWYTPFHRIMQDARIGRVGGQGPPNAQYGALQNMSTAERLNMLQQLLMRAYGPGMGPKFGQN